ncbi:hypothetical protein FQR65_LT14360 [Abscondita terminalis]|nr:hypothetical protein FQR65_LT14360 [Abscondita terminalis]
MDGVEKVQIEKLRDESNWPQWQFVVRTILDCNGALEVCEGTLVKPEPPGATSEQTQKAYQETLKKWIKADQLARKLFVTTVESKPLGFLMNAGTACEMWRKLHSVYDLQSDETLALVQKQFFDFKWNTSMSIGEHIVKLEQLTNRMRKLNATIPDSMLISRILSVLPAEYKHFHSAWDSTAAEQKTLDNLTTRLLIEEQRVKNQGAEGVEETVALLTKVKLNHRYKRIRFKGKPGCYTCGKKDHLRKDCPGCSACGSKQHLIKKCPSKKENERSRDGGNGSQPLAFVGNALNEKNKDDWIIDTGASDHMCNNRNIFKDFETFSETVNVNIGNGEKVSVLGKGTVEIECLVQGEWTPAKICDVLYTPNMICNLFSVKTAAKKGIDFIIKNAGSECVFTLNGKVVATGTDVGDLFKMNLRVITQKRGNLRKDCPGCSACGSKQHLIKKCPSKKENERSRDGGNGSQPLAFVGNALNEKNKDDWIIDTGASDHMCNNRNIFTDFETFSETVNVNIGNGEKVSVLGKGTVEIECLVQGEWTPAKICDVLYTPNMICNLFSVKTAAKKGIDFIIKNAGSECVFTLNGKVVATGTDVGDLFKMNLRVITQKCHVHVSQELGRKLERKSTKGYFVGYHDGLCGYRIFIPEKNDIVITRDVIFKQEMPQSSTCVHEDSIKIQKALIDKVFPKLVELRENCELDVDSDVEQHEESTDCDSEENDAMHEVEADEMPVENKRRNLRDRSAIRKPTYLDHYTMLPEENVNLCDLVLTIKELQRAVEKQQNETININKILECITSIKSDINSISSRLNEVELKIHSLSNNPNCSNVSSDSIDNNKLILKEFHERSSRANNILIFNIDEATSDNDTSNNDLDSAVIHKILRPIGINSINKIFRIGKKSNKSRPIKVILTSPDDVHKVLKNKKLLPPNTSVAPDRTDMQRNELKSAYNELNRRRENGENNLFIKFIHETWLTNSVNDAELFPSSYQVFRSDRIGKRGGGVLIAVKNEYFVKPLHLSSNCAMEIIGVTITLGSFFATLVCVYIPPQISVAEYSLAFEYLSETLLNYKNVVIAGDFNIPDYAQSLDHINNNGLTNLLNCFLRFLDLKQLNHIHNARNRLLDLIIASRGIINLVSHDPDPLVTEDVFHPALLVNIVLIKGPTNNNFRTKSTGKFNFRRANLRDLYVSIGSIDWSELYTINNIDDACTFIYAMLYEAFNKHVPKYSFRDAFKEIPTINFYNRSNSETHIQHTVGKSISFVDAPKRSCARNVYYAEESDSDENDHFHDNDDDRDGCYIPDIDCSDEESENVVEVVTEVDEEDDVEDALNNLCSDVEDLFVEDGGVIDEAPAQVTDRRPRLRKVQEGPLKGKKVPVHLFPPDIEPEVPNESLVYSKDGTCWHFEEPKVTRIRAHNVLRAIGGPSKVFDDAFNHT